MKPHQELFYINPSQIKRDSSSNYSKKEVTQFRGAESPLFEAISPAFYIIRTFGLGPYHFLNDRLVPSNIHLIFCFLAFTFNSYIAISVLFRFTIKSNTAVLSITERAKVF